MQLVVSGGFSLEKISKKLSRVAKAVLGKYYMGAYGQISYQSLESGEWGATKIE